MSGASLTHATHNLISDKLCSSDCNHILTTHGSSAAAILPGEQVRVPSTHNVAALALIDGTR